jgi:hypothetical protein
MQFLASATDAESQSGNRLAVATSQTRDGALADALTLRQGSLFQKAPAQELEKIPFDFSYEFRYKKLFCPGHKMICTDWEMGKNDTHFYVGNLHQFPNAWIVIGLFYPPHQTTQDMFFK